MPSKVARNPSLIARVRECFFGFPDSAVESHFLKQQVQQRMCGMIVLSVASLGSSVHKLLQSGVFRSNPVGSILMEPGAPVLTVFFLFVLFMGRWRWVEPTVVALAVCRQRLEVPFGTISSWCAFSLMLASVNYLQNVRAKFGLVHALVWSVMAPYVAERSPGTIPSWPPVEATTVLVRQPYCPSWPASPACLKGALVRKMHCPSRQASPAC
eukprot:gene4447-14597_t